MIYKLITIIKIKSKCTQWCIKANNCAVLFKYAIKLVSNVHSVQYIITEVDSSLQFNIKSIYVSATMRRFCLSSYISTAKENV